MCYDLPLALKLLVEKSSNYMFALCFYAIDYGVFVHFYLFVRAFLIWILRDKRDPFFLFKMVCKRLVQLHNL